MSTRQLVPAGLGLGVVAVMGMSALVPTPTAIAASAGLGVRSAAAPWADEALAAIEAEFVAGRAGVSDALAFASPELVVDDRPWSGRVLEGRDAVSRHLATMYGLTLDEFRLDGALVDANGAVIQLHVDHLPGLGSDADVLQLRSYGPDGVDRISTLVAIATLRRRPGALGTDGFDAWERFAGRYVDAWAGRDPAVLQELYAPDVELTDTVAGRRLVGSAAVRRTVHASVTTRVIRSADRGVESLPPDVTEPGLDPAVYLDHRVHQAARTVAIVHRTELRPGCIGVVGSLLTVERGRIRTERRFHDVGSARRCLGALPSGWWDQQRPRQETRPTILHHAGTRIELRGATPRLTGLVRWALGRFDAVALAPPAVAGVTFVGATGRCSGVAGTARRSDRGALIELCLDDEAVCVDPGCRAFTGLARATVLHELAHAWEFSNVTGTTRDAYLAATGLPAWHDGERPWNERGEERAAEVIMWGLSPQPLPLPRIGEPSCWRTEAEFRLLTGVASGHGSCPVQPAD